ncbi:glutamine-hydrolyzing carbamoyl-phosphate synthase small subunit [Tumebacillus sp. ITR2]|uniref:Carbamoyl phosphate synthase small chain n=1 Tax=Tumebacillus amylolyticus TaxID=2801339 RepID=A0ABS1JED4_9BACL|nr:glutamine-hydrolyzing carbamoyl-phosphate synthase small subunit [Tumebacillus amylolyticus]MBL0388657.1 glutamine-hydrolyzing carbamoyl-phosphate synthase small subunit [Tumebacillus amylolyticus]
MRARMILQDGSVWEGLAFGAEGEAYGDVVFNTGMTGYQEILTDPSYCGQIVAMTYPLIGNYGINEQDLESRQPHLRGFIVKEWAEHPSNWRSVSNLHAFLLERGVVGLSGADTRSLVRHLRERGTMKGVITTLEMPLSYYLDRLQEEDLLARDLVAEVTTGEPFSVGAGTRRVVALDCGIKAGILDELTARSCEVVVVGAHTSAEEIFAWKPDGVFLSNGPGDPQDVPEIVETVKALIGKVPLFGICLGHQLIALACGARIERMKYGHRGTNHPVKELATGRCAITSQNHGFVVNAASLADTELEITHLNLNDGTVEGLRHRNHPCFSVQFHPEARPGPIDSRGLFDSFVQLIDKHKEGQPLPELQLRFD